MLRAIEAPPGSCVTEPEVSPSINDEHVWLKLPSDPGAGPVGQGQEDDVMARQVLCRGGDDLAVRQGSQVGLMVSQALPH